MRAHRRVAECPGEWRWEIPDVRLHNKLIDRLIKTHHKTRPEQRDGGMIERRYVIGDDHRTARIVRNARLADDDAAERRHESE